MYVKGVLVYIVYVFMIVTVGSASQEKENMSEEAQEDLLASLINSGEINQDKAELVWLNCRIELIDAMATVQDLEFYIQENKLTGNNGIVSKGMSRTKDDKQKFINFLHPLVKQTLEDCLRKKNLMFLVSGEGKGSKAWYTRFMDSLFARHSPAKQYELIQRFGESPFPYHKVRPKAFKSEPPADPPVQPFLSQNVLGSSLKPGARELLQASNDQANHTQTLIIAVSVTAAVTSIVVSLFFICYLKIFYNGPGLGPNDEKPLLSLSRSDYSAASASSQNAPPPFGNSLSNRNHGNCSVSKNSGEKMCENLSVEPQGESTSKLEAPIGGISSVSANSVEDSAQVAPGLGAYALPPSGMVVPEEPPPAIPPPDEAADPSPPPPPPPEEAAPSPPTPPEEAAPSPPIPPEEAAPSPPIPPEEAAPSPPIPPEEAAPSPPIPPEEAAPSPPTPPEETAPSPPPPPEEAAPSPPSPPEEVEAAALPPPPPPEEAAVPLLRLPPRRASHAVTAPDEPGPAAPGEGALLPLKPPPGRVVPAVAVAPSPPPPNGGIPPPSPPSRQFSGPPPPSPPTPGNGPTIPPPPGGGGPLQPSGAGPSLQRVTSAGPPPPPPPGGGAAPSLARVPSAGPPPPPPPGGGGDPSLARVPSAGPPPPPGPGGVASPRPPPPGMKLPRPPSVGAGGRPAPAGPPKAKLKPFFWDKVLANPDHAMVWHQIKSGSFQFNEEMIETLFGCAAQEKANKEAKKDTSAKQKAPQFIQIIDQKKAQNISILLKALNVTTEEVCDAIREGNELPPELVQTLLRMAPTSDEELKLRLYADDLSKLGHADRFMKIIVDTPFAFKRLETLLFMCTLQEEAAGVKESYKTLEDACTELQNSRLFMKLLEAVLKTGNRMNDGTYRGGAQAFKLDTLLKLSDVKGVDGKITLLHFVVQEIVRTEGMRAVRAAKELRSMSSIVSEDLVHDVTHEASDEHLKNIGLQVVSGLGTELENVKKCAIIDADALQTTVSKLSQGLVLARGVLNSLIDNLAPEDGFYHTLKDFVQDAGAEVAWLNAEEKRIMARVKSTCDYFHGNNAKDEGLRIFVVVRDFLLILDKVCKEIKAAQLAKPKQDTKSKES